MGANANITGPWRTSWLDHAESLFDAPLTMRYTDLDPTAHYKLRVVYAGDGLEKKIRLVSRRRLEIHPYIAKPRTYRADRVRYSARSDQQRPVDFALESRAGTRR